MNMKTRYPHCGTFETDISDDSPSWNSTETTSRTLAVMSTRSNETEHEDQVPALQHTESDILDASLRHCMGSTHPQSFSPIQGSETRSTRTPETAPDDQEESVITVTVCDENEKELMKCEIDCQGDTNCDIPDPLNQHNSSITEPGILYDFSRQKSTGTASSELAAISTLSDHTGYREHVREVAASENVEVDILDDSPRRKTTETTHNTLVALSIQRHQVPSPLCMETDILDDSPRRKMTETASSPSAAMSTQSDEPEHEDQVPTL